MSNGRGRTAKGLCGGIWCCGGRLGKSSVEVRAEASGKLTKEMLLGFAPKEGPATNEISEPVVETGARALPGRGVALIVGELDGLFAGAGGKTVGCGFV